MMGGFLGMPGNSQGTVKAVVGVIGAVAGTLGAAVGAAAQTLDTTPLPAIARIEGPFWSWVLPAALFALSLGATLLLYRHFARDP